MVWPYISRSSTRMKLACACFSLVLLQVAKVRCMSIDKKIINASSAEMLERFHIMPDGEVKVMTELDLLLSFDQYKQMYSEASSRPKRKAIRDVSTRWKNCKVYYEITDDRLSKEDRELIRFAIEEWEKYTCLDFIESSSSSSRIQFKHGDGCYSELGMQSKPQVVVLSPGCRKTPGIVIHEIGHAVGWYHEHMRPDRDDYIKINIDNVPKKYHPNFMKYDGDVINTYNIPYDYTSIMHYGTDGYPGSITTLDPKYQGEIGQREGLTFKDIKLANLMYRCADVMGCETKTCDRHNGFVLYKKFKGAEKCQCWCDSGNVDDPLQLCSSIDKEPEPPKPGPVPEGPIIKLCYDVRDDCAEIKAQGMCRIQIVLMMDDCAKTCEFCGKGDDMCMDHEMGCPILARSGGCTNPGLKSTLTTLCPASCNLCSEPPDPCKIQHEFLGSAYENGGIRVTAPFWNWVCIAILGIKLTPRKTCIWF